MGGFIDAVIGHLHYAGLFLLLLLGGLGAPFPEDLILLSCGVLISTGALEPAPTLLAVYTGMLVSDFMLYNLGKKFGRRLLDKRRFKRLLPPGRLADLERRFNRRSVLVILLGRHLAGLRAQIFLVSGITGMPPVKFVLADAVSATLTLTVMVWLGYRGGLSAQALSRHFAQFEHMAIVGGVGALAAYLVYRYISYLRGHATP